MNIINWKGNRLDFLTFWSPSRREEKVHLTIFGQLVFSMKYVTKNIQHHKNDNLTAVIYML